MSMIETMSLNEYLGRIGLSMPISDFMLDKSRIPHGLTARQKKQLEKESQIAADTYAEKRNNAIAEYNRKIENGEIKKKPSLEITIQRAKYGHPDNESTQAARRVLEKRGISYG